LGERHVQGGKGGAGLGRVARVAVQLPCAHLADAVHHRRHRRYNDVHLTVTPMHSFSSVLFGPSGEATVVDYVLSMAHHDWEGCTGNLAQVSMQR